MRYVNSLFDFFVIFDNEKSRKLACKGLRLRTLSVNHNNVIEQIADKLIESQNDRLNDTSVRAVLNKQKVQLEKQIDFDNPGNNIFKVVNQVEIQGKSELRIPDARKRNRIQKRRRLFEISSLKSRSAWFENGTEKARKQRNEHSKRLIKSVFLGNADISGIQKRYFCEKVRFYRAFFVSESL